MASKRVVVTGLGLVTPLGTSVQKSWTNLIAGKSGIVSTQTLPNHEAYSNIPSQVIGRVPDMDEHESFFTQGEQRRLAQFSKYALLATHEALKDSQWNPTSPEEQCRTGVVIGSGIGSIQDAYENSVAFESKGYKKVSPLFVPRLLVNMAAGAISIKYGFKGVSHSVSTACATGNHAIGDAYRFIKDGMADVIVSGASEASIHPLSLSGFARAKSLVTKYNDTPYKASRPFDKDRDGFVLGEGCGIMVLEELEHAKARGASIYAEIVGYGLSSDGYHITAPLEDGDGARRAMEMALMSVDKTKVGYVNAHATSTQLGDRAENRAIKSVFGERNGILVSSTKSSIGHLLGAAGAVESIFTVLALKEAIVPPTLNLENPGQCVGDTPEEFTFDYVAKEARNVEIEYAISNSFGFGGVNSSLCFKKWNE